MKQSGGFPPSVGHPRGTFHAACVPAVLRRSQVFPGRAAVLSIPVMIVSGTSVQLRSIGTSVPQRRKWP